MSFCKSYLTPLQILSKEVVIIRKIIICLTSTATSNNTFATSDVLNAIILSRKAVKIYFTCRSKVQLNSLTTKMALGILRVILIVNKVVRGTQRVKQSVNNETKMLVFQQAALSLQSSH